MSDDATELSDAVPGNSLTAGDYLDGALSWAGGIFRAPFMKAANRLLLGAANVPAAWLEAKVNDLRDSQAIRERARKHQQILKEKIDNAAAKVLIAGLRDRPEIVDMLADRWVFETASKMHNAEAVLRIAAEELNASSPDSAGEQEPRSPDDLDDDWLNGFASHAERATTERMRTLFGKVLAGEIRRRGAFSLFTVDFLSKMGNEEAQLIARIAPFVLGSGIPMVPSAQSILDYGTESRLVHIGILSAASGGRLGGASFLTKLMPDTRFPDAFVGYLIYRDWLIQFSAATETELSIPAYPLSVLAKEIFSLYKRDLDSLMLSEVASHAKKKGVNTFIARITSRDGDQINIDKLRPVMPAP